MQSNELVASGFGFHSYSILQHIRFPLHLDFKNYSQKFKRDEEANMFVKETERPQCVHAKAFVKQVPCIWHSVDSGVTILNYGSLHIISKNLGFVIANSTTLLIEYEILDLIINIIH